MIESLVPSVLEQRITTGSAHCAWRRLLNRYGEEPPEPAPEEMRVAPSAAVWRTVPSWEWHRAGVDRSRKAAILRPCSYAPRLEGAAAMEMPVAMARLQLVPGIGPWARRRGLPTHPWGPDALTLGDLHLPVQIGYALTGARRGTGVQTLQLLQPYAGQRYRAARLLINAGPDAWYRGDPRKLSVETHEEWWAATRNPDVVRAMLEDYRAGLTIDRERKRRITPGARGST
ncbi:hypothetical protein ABZ943_25895, partial [Streptomyces rubiginosohelvolus]